MDKSLFKIESEYLAIASELEENGGELTPELEQALAINKEELSIKGENYISLINKLKSEAQWAKNYEEQAKRVRQSKEKAVDRLEEALKNAAILYGEFQAGIHTVKTRKSEIVVIEDVDKVPNEFKVYEPKPDKVAIKAAIKAGQEVEGAYIEQKPNLAIK